MPFANEYDDIYNYGIKESCIEAGTYCERVDEQIFNDTIMARVYNQIAKADLIIADMSNKNPNVFYEVGYAHALNKPTILLTKTIADIPFDLQSYPHIVYDGKISTIRSELVKRILWFKDNIKNDPASYKNTIDLYVGSVKLNTDQTFVKYERGKYPNFELTVLNASPFAYEQGKFQIGLLTDDYEFCELNGHDDLIETIRLPDYTILHMFPFFERLLPGVYKSVKVVLKNMESIYTGLPNFDIVLRVFTDLGYRDYCIRMMIDE